MIRRKASTQTKRRTGVRTYFLIFVCGLLTVSGFFFAGRQHFSWMDYGMKNSRLRKQIDDLQAEKRRLLLARETSLAPDEIKKAAKKFLGGGTTEPTVSMSSSVATVQPKALLTTDRVTDKPMVERTVSIAPTSAAVTASLKKTVKSKTPTKVTPATE